MISRKGLDGILIIFLFVFSISSCGGGGGVSEQVVNPNTPVPQSAILSWDPVTINIDNSPCTDLAGYRIYYGEQHPVNKNNSQMVDVGNTLSAQIDNLPIGHTYYFCVSSYDTSNNESDLSMQVSKTIN